MFFFEESDVQAQPPSDIPWAFWAAWLGAFSSTGLESAP